MSQRIRDAVMSQQPAERLSLVDTTAYLLMPSISKMQRLLLMDIHALEPAVEEH